MPLAQSVITATAVKWINGSFYIKTDVEFVDVGGFYDGCPGYLYLPISQGHIVDDCFAVNARLGLAFCRKAVERHGGTIAVEDAQPKGSCFFFVLPSLNDASGSGSKRARA